MDKPLVTIKYKTANGSEICVEVSTPVKELLEQSTRQIQSQRRQDRRHLDYVDFIDGLTDTAMMNPQEDIADLVIRMESYQRLHAAINQLSDIQRRRLTLNFIDNLTHRQIAEIEGVDQAAIGRSIKRALNQLCKLLAE
ncbi:sigma factor-like helix-turn-helix DNA-binding protein [Oscillibacter sp.]|uniref:RNA polymerase sigma factor n=1 Tax=Oscillibacter sp. TaxID=1945593 RepID=UPI0028A1E628|nr:sigma factor-like helix-turn-helix DNA-binding protein [Oscillibacter sp.]